MKKFRKKSRKLLDNACFIYYKIVPFDWRPGQIWYRFKCWSWKRYTTIKCRYLPHTWIDRTDVLPHTMFEILSRFIENECSPGIVDWEGSGHIVVVDGVKKNVRIEMQDLYNWWHNAYNKEYAEVNDIFSQELSKHSAIREFIPINVAGDEISDDDAEYFCWDNEFLTLDDKEIYNRCLSAMSKLEQMRNEKLYEMMHRLVNIVPYLWT